MDDVKFQNAMTEAKRREIHFKGLVYRPYVKGLEDGFDRVKNGERRPYGWDHYLFVGGYVVFKDGSCVGSIKELPRALQLGEDLV